MKRIAWLVGTVVILLAGLGVGLGLGLGWHRARQSAETGPGGRSVEQWLERLRSPDAEEGRAAAETLAGLGEPGLEVLLQARKDGDIRAHRRAAAALAGRGGDAAVPLLPALKRGGARVEVILVRIGPPAIPALEGALRDRESAQSAARLLGLMGARGRPAIPALAALLQDLRARDDARAATAQALGQIGPEKLDGPGQTAASDPVLGALTAALSGPPAVQRAAALALGELGPAARPAIGSLARLSRDSDVEVARAACFALGQTRSQAAAPALLARLQQADAASPVAASGLARLGPEARAAVSGLIVSQAGTKDDVRLAQAVLERLGTVAVPDLVEALKAPGAAARGAAADALGLMGPRAAAAGPSLEALLNDRELPVLLAAARALVRIAPERSKAVVPAVLPLLLLPQENLAVGAAGVLAALGPDAARAAPVLVHALKAKDNRVARAAAVLGRLRPPPAEVVTALAEALSGYEKGRPACAQALGQLGAAAKPAVPALVAALKDPAVRPYAALALVRVEPARAADVARALTPDLESTSEPGRSLALAALAQMRPPPPGVVPAVRALLSEGPSARAALIVLEALDGKQLAPLVADLATLLSSSDPRLREAAIELLGKVGPSTVPGLQAALKNRSPTIRAASARAWGAVQAGARGRDSSVLLPLLDDPDPIVRHSAAEVIADLGTEQDETRQAMLALLARPEAELRRAAARLPQSGESGPGEWQPYLLECLFDPDVEVRQQAALSLLHKAESTEAIQGLLGDPAPAVRLVVARQLLSERRLPRRLQLEAFAVVDDLARRAAPGQRGELLRALASVRLNPDQARALLDELEADLRADEVDVRLDAAAALVQIDPSRAAVVLPLVAGILEGWEESARLRAARALQTLAAAARPALPALRRCVERDDSEVVRRAAEAAIRAIGGKTPPGTRKSSCNRPGVSREAQGYAPPVADRG